MAAAVFMSQIQVMLLRIAKRHVLRPVPDGTGLNIDGNG